jgi:poly(ribitol-phosphate) beta-N-acetylglucosaminyltransferase
VTIKVSVVVPTYNSGERIMHVIDSLDAQSLPSHEFEAVFVDDGSTDGTYDRLKALAADRAYLRLEQIPNSGWPGRPRNVGTALARGDYVLYMDHDDELFPEALERAYRFGTENHSDVIIAKEVLTDGWSPGWEAFRVDVPRVPVITEDIAALLTPHKFYRRAFLAQHDIRFPEGRWRLEDHYLNAQAYALADVVSVLASYPCYRWVMHEDNNFRRGADPAFYWGCVRSAVQIVERLVPAGPRRDELLMRWYRRRVLDVVGPKLVDWSDVQRAAALPILRDLVHTHFGEHLDARLLPTQRPRARLLRAGDADALARLAEHDRGVTVESRVTDLHWDDGALVVSAVSTLVDRAGEPFPLRRDGDRVSRLLPPDLADVCTAAERDVTDQLAGARVELTVRGRRSRVEWPVATEGEVIFAERDGAPVVEARWQARLDPRTAAYGQPLDENIWDLAVRFSALGATSHRRLPAPAVAMAPALVDGRPVVPYATRNGLLSLDLAEEGRGLVAAAGPTAKDVLVAGDALTVTLPRLHVTGKARLDVEVFVGGATTLGELSVDEKIATVQAPVVAPTASTPVDMRTGGRRHNTGLILHRAPSGRIVPACPGETRSQLGIADVRWRAGALRITVSYELTEVDGAPLTFEHHGGRVYLPTGMVADGVPLAERVVTTALLGVRFEAQRRGADDRYPVPAHRETVTVPRPDGTASLADTYELLFDPATADGGAALADGTFDFYACLGALGGGRRVRLGPVAPPQLPDAGVAALLAADRRPAVAYGTAEHGNLSLSLNQGWTPAVADAAARTPLSATLGGNGRLTVATPVHCAHRRPLRCRLSVVLPDGAKESFAATAVAADDGSRVSATVTERVLRALDPGGHSTLRLDSRPGKRVSLPLGRLDAARVVRETSRLPAIGGWGGLVARLRGVVGRRR